MFSACREHFLQKSCRIRLPTIEIHENQRCSRSCSSATTWSLIMFWHKINIYAARSLDCSYQKDHTVGGSSIKLMKREQNFAKKSIFSTLNTLLCWLWESLANEVDFQIIVSLYIRFLDDYLIFLDVQTGVEKLKACIRRWKQSR